MKNSPSINFRRSNANIQVATPSRGISHVLARTNKGAFNDPSLVITSVAQFRDVFGFEIVPDNSVSNIERALLNGSRLRIARVEGGAGATKGVAKLYDTTTGVAGETEATLSLNMTNPLDDSFIEVSFKIKTKEPGSSILDPNSPASNSNFYLKFIRTSNVLDVNTTLYNYYLEQYKVVTDNIIADLPDDIPGNLLSRNHVLKSVASQTAGLNSVDVNGFEDFYYNTPNVEFNINTVQSDVVGFSTDSIQSMEDLINIMKMYRNWRTEFNMMTPTLYYIINEGSDGGLSTKATWEKAYESISGYKDGYQLIASHLHQHLTETYEETYKAISDQVKLNEEIVLYVEIPKKDSTGFLNYTNTVTKLKSMAAAIGYHPFVAYFGGGIKLYDRNSVIRGCDVLGTVLALGDTSATNHGPYYSFSGMNRGLVFDAQGSTMVGGEALTQTQLNELAENCMNLFLVQDTPTAGKRTMLWHSFTGSLLNSSEQYLSSIRAYLYMKKSLRPIIQKYIEEPNTFSTWKNLYYEVLPILNPLTGVVFTEFEWKGDQFATSYEDLQVNKEADVRLGKYHIILSYRDIVTLQEITMDFYIDRSNSLITINNL